MALLDPTVPAAVTLATDTLNHYAPLAVLLAMAIIFGVGNLAATHLIGPSRAGKVKGTVYESGMNPLTSAKRRFNVRFYVVAMTFLVFDVEIVFLYPGAMTLPNLGGSEGEALGPMFMARMLFFILTTLIAFAYAWRKGVFKYD